MCPAAHDANICAVPAARVRAYRDGDDRGGSDPRRSVRQMWRTRPCAHDGVRSRYIVKGEPARVDRRRYRAQLVPPQTECAERQSVCRAESASGLTGSLEPLDQFLPLRGGAPRRMLCTACPRHDFVRLRVLGSGE